MLIEYDDTKNVRNLRERGLSFDRARDFDFTSAKIWEDLRQPYPESRFVAMGFLDNRLHVLIFSRTYRGIRVISFRKANLREGKKHGFTLTRD